MKTIKCQNKYRNEEGQEVTCGRIIGTLTDMQVDMLKLDPEGGPIFRCPKCHPEQRWIKISGDSSGNTFEVLEMAPELKEDIKFENLIICEQVG